jgi:molecular chaperone GrpE
MNNNQDIEKKIEENTDKIELEGKRDELARCLKERDEYLDGWKRAKAELLNYKKEENKRFEEVIKFANETLIRELISVLDSFALALTTFEQIPLAGASGVLKEKDEIKNIEASEGWKIVVSWQKGLFLIKQQLEDILKQVGLERVSVVLGEMFDPRLQEAVASVDSDKPSGTVVEEVEAGYMLNGKLLRPARVKIAK